MESSQRALHIAILILDNGTACGVDELQQKCCLFPVSSPEIHDLCALQGSPLQILEDNKIGLAVKFLVELRSRLDNFRGTCNTAPRGNRSNYLVPAVKDEIVQDLDIKEKSPLPKRIPQFQDYVVLGEEGSGGYGTVYRVRRNRDNQLFAIKCPLEKTSPEHVKQEIKMLQNLGGQEYIIRCEEVVWEVLSMDTEGRLKENQRPNLVLQYVDHDKPEILKKEITVQELQLYGYCLFKALAYLHSQGIVHRDVKPGNFLFSRTRGTGFLVDFHLALVVPTATVASGKCKRTCSTASKDSAKGEANKELRTASSKTTLGKRVRKEAELMPLKRHQISNIHDNQARYPCSIKSPQADFVTRVTIPPLKSDQPSVFTQSTIQRILNPKVNGGATSTPGAVVDSSPKVPIVCDPVNPMLRSRQRWRFLKFVTVSREPDDGPPQSALGDLARMPQTAGVLRFAQYLRNRNLTQTSATTPTPPASKRKRVAAIQVNKNASVRPPISPPRPSSKGAGVHRPFPLAKDGPCAGTKGYRAPEVLLKSNIQTTKLDIWSAGVSLLQLIAGKSPFPSSSSEQALWEIAKLRGVDDLLKLAGGHDCLHKLPLNFETLNYKPMPVFNWFTTYARRSEMRDRIPPELCDLLEKCLQVDPNIRIDASEALSHDFFKSVEERVAHSIDREFSSPTKVSV